MLRYVRLGHPKLIAVTLVVVLLGAALVLAGRDDTRTVVAHFDRAVAVYPGTDLRVMGVQIGQVRSVVPEGSSVRVEMTYDSEYQIPSDAQAAVVTPTLVADRYVQVFPAYAGGAAMPDGGDIPVDRTQTPVELDRVYRSLNDLAVTLGPEDGETTGGALDDLLSGGAKALDGNGELGARTIRNLSSAADTLARNRGPLFANVRALASITDTLAENDETVDTFVSELATTSDQLAGDREELATLLDTLARVLGTVRGFVDENREVLGRDVKRLTSILERVDNQRDSVGLVAQKGALAIGNFAVSFDNTSGTFSSRVQPTEALNRPDLLLCETVKNAGVPPAAASTVCSLLDSLLKPLLPALDGADAASAAPAEAGADAQPDEAQQAAPEPTLAPPDVDGEVKSLLELLGGGAG